MSVTPMSRWKIGAYLRLKDLKNSVDLKNGRKTEFMHEKVNIKNIVLPTWVSDPEEERFLVLLFQINLNKSLVTFK